MLQVYMKYDTLGVIGKIRCLFLKRCCWFENLVFRNSKPNGRGEFERRSSTNLFLYRFTIFASYLVSWNRETNIYYVFLFILCMLFLWMRNFNIWKNVSDGWTISPWTESREMLLSSNSIHVFSSVTFFKLTTV